jgi:hypothetical protein
MGTNEVLTAPEPAINVGDMPEAAIPEAEEAGLTYQRAGRTGT